MFESIREVRRSILSAALVAAIAVVLGAGVAHAGVIAGPTLTSEDSDYYYSGIGFTATVNSTLTSFTFENQGLADVVDLVDPNGNVLDQVATAAGNTSYTATVNWSLTAGAQYYLLQSTYNNGLFASWGTSAPSDAQIALTDTGDFSYTSPASANFSYGGAGGGGTDYWADFTNITTSPAGGSIPEPASFTLVLPFAVAVLLRARRKGLVRNE